MQENKTKEALKVKLTRTEADRIAGRVCEEIEASEMAKEWLLPRWRRIEDIYRCDPKGSNLHLVDGMKPYVMPLYRQKAQAIVRTVMGAYFSITPWAQMIDISGMQDAQTVERTLQAFLEDSRLKAVSQKALLNMVHFNCGMLRLRVDPDGNLETDSIHPEHSCMYPVQVSSPEQLKTIGHRFHLMRFEIADRLAAGEFDKEFSEPENFGKAHIETTQDALSAKSEAVDADDDQIECWEVCTKIRLKGDKERRWYLATVERSSRQLLRLERFPYSAPWYFVFRTNFDEDNMYPSDSVGNVLQGLQVTYNDIYTTVIQGSYMQAFPLTVITGGMLNNKVTSYQPGQIIESSSDLRVQNLVTPFNPGQLILASQKIEELADAISGISRLGTSQTLPASTSATAASGFLAAQSESKDQYVENVEVSFSRMFEFAFELLQKHEHQVADNLGLKWEIPEGANIDPSAIRIEPTGGGATTDPRLLGQKLSMLQNLAQNPASRLDPVKVELKIIETLDLPFSTESLMKPPVPPMPPPGMPGMPGGLPGMPGGGGPMPGGPPMDGPPMDGPSMAGPGGPPMPVPHENNPNSPALDPDLAGRLEQILRQQGMGGDQSPLPQNFSGADLEALKSLAGL